jgi:hypothetical protein
MYPTSRLPRHYRAASLAVALAFAMSAAGAVAAESKPEVPPGRLGQTAVHHLGWADPLIAAMVERSAAALVDVLERADQALAGQSPVLAVSNLAYAENIARGIALQTPYVEIKARLETARKSLEASAAHDFVDDLAPVYASIDDLMLVAPEMAQKVKAEVRQAEGKAQAGAREQALGQVDALIREIVATRVYLPIAYVEGQIDVARKALVRSDIKGARAAVEKALDSLVVIASNGSGSAPLAVGSGTHGT